MDGFPMLEDVTKAIALVTIPPTGKYLVAMQYSYLAHQFGTSKIIKTSCWNQHAGKLGFDLQNGFAAPCVIFLHPIHCLKAFHPVN